MPKPRAPTHAQVCAIARRLIDADPSIDDAEWREQIKCAIAAQRLAYPPPHGISDAMDRVERALDKVRGPRPLPLPATPAAEPEPEPQPLTRDEARAALSRIAERLQLPPMKPRRVPDVTPDALRAERAYSETVEPLDEGQYQRMAAAVDRAWQRAEWRRQRQAARDEQRAASDRAVHGAGKT